MQQREDWYAYLRLSPEATTEQIEQAVERLSRQAASLAATAPERSQLLRETVRSIKRDLLSGQESRQRYDAGRAAALQQAAPAGQQFTPPPAQQFSPPPAQQFAAPGQPVPGAQAPNAAEPQAAGPWPAYPGQQPAAPIPVSPAPAFAGETMSSRISRFLRTGWTCSSCGKDAVPSDKFCTKCGSPIKPVQPDTSAPRTRPVCANCAGPLSMHDAFCARCGTPVRK
jgi:DnaJ-class molecular chaperone